MTDPGCGCNGDVLLSQQSSQNNVNIDIIGNPPIYVQKQVLATKTLFTISYSELAALAGTIGMSNLVTNPSGTSYLSGAIPLKGVTVTGLTLDWTLTKNAIAASVATQLLNTVDIGEVVRQYVYSSLNLTKDSSLANRTFTLVASDGLGNPGSSVTLQAVLNFGDKIYIGEGPLIEDDDNALRTLLQGFSYQIRTNKNVSALPQSLSPDVYQYFAIPSNLGDAEFRDITSPLDVEVCRLLKEDFTLSNGLINVTTNIYVAKQGGLRNANIQVI